MRATELLKKRIYVTAANKESGWADERNKLQTPLRGLAKRPSAPLAPCLD